MRTITVYISTEAQRQALLADEDAASTQTYDVPPDLLPRLLELPWAIVGENGDVTCRTPLYHALEERPADADAAITAAEALAEKLAQRDREREREQREHYRWLNSRRQHEAEQREQRKRETAERHRASVAEYERALTTLFGQRAVLITLTAPLGKVVTLRRLL